MHLFVSDDDFEKEVELRLQKRLEENADRYKLEIINMIEQDFDTDRISKLISMKDVQGLSNNKLSKLASLARSWLNKKEFHDFMNLLYAQAARKQDELERPNGAPDDITLEEYKNLDNELSQVRRSLYDLYRMIRTIIRLDDARKEKDKLQKQFDKSQAEKEEVINERVARKRAGLKIFQDPEEDTESNT